MHEVLEVQGFDVVLVDTREVGRVPGRDKSDRRDCEWVQRLHSCGLLRGAFRPGEHVAQLIYRLLRWGQPYLDEGAAAYEKRYREARVNRLAATAKDLGYTLVSAEACGILEKESQTSYDFLCRLSWAPVLLCYGHHASALTSVLRLRRVDAIDPLQNPALQVLHALEALIARCTTALALRVPDLQRTTTVVRNRTLELKTPFRCG